MLKENVIYKKNNKGITLVALVITIIVLLILAGVSLNLVAGSNGILGRAQKAVDVNNMAQIKEEIELKIAELQMDYYMTDNNFANVNDYVKAELEKGVELPSGAVITTDSSGNLSYDGMQIGTLNSDGSVSIDGEFNGSQIVTKYTVSYNANGGQGGPASSRHENGETVRVDFSKTPTQTGCTFLGWARSSTATMPEFTNSGSFTINGNTTLYAVWEYGQAWHAAHPELHIPTGFAHTEGTVDTGYVIKDSEGNEFVWIPVANDEAYSKKLGTNNYYLKPDNVVPTSVADGIKGDKLGVTSILGTTIENSITAQQPEYSVVKKAGGFWVGRYEVGVESIDRGVGSYIAGIPEWSNDKSADANAYWANKSITVKAGNEPIRVITQSKALERANNWKSGKAGNGTVAFQSGMITGSQWDAMCKFIGWDVANSDCSNWGNYTNVKSKIYTSLTHSEDFRSDWFIESNIQKGSSNNRWIFPTGVFINENNQVTMKKNIYDIAGNVWEWTTEIPQGNDNVVPVRRGGSAPYNGLEYAASCRSGDENSGEITAWGMGFRMVLYVE